MTEDRLQQDCFIWHSNTYPNKRGLLYHNFNNPRNAIQGAKLKTMGLVSGVADLTLLHKSKTYFFELKTTTGRQSKSQIILVFGKMSIWIVNRVFWALLIQVYNIKEILRVYIA